MAADSQSCVFIIWLSTACESANDAGGSIGNSAPLICRPNLLNAPRRSHQLVRQRQIERPIDFVCFSLPAAAPPAQEAEDVNIVTSRRRPRRSGGGGGYLTGAAASCCALAANDRLGQKLPPAQQVGICCRVVP